MRAFFAIEFPESIKEYLNQLQMSIKEKSISGNFTRKENFHLTLRFIGEINNNEFIKFKESIDEIALNQKDFHLTINKLGYFSRGNKKIVWAGIQPDEMLNQLYSKLERSLEYKGYKAEEKKYVPHITIGREIVLAEEFNKIEQTVNMDKAVLTVKKVSLMESARLNGELKYIPLYSKEFS